MKKILPFAIFAGVVYYIYNKAETYYYVHIKGSDMEISPLLDIKAITPSTEIPNSLIPDYVIPDLNAVGSINGIPVLTLKDEKKYKSPDELPKSFIISGSLYFAFITAGFFILYNIKKMRDRMIDRPPQGDEYVQLD